MKKIVSFLLILLLIFLAACGSNSSDTAQDTSSVSNSAAESGEVSSAPADTAEVSAEPAVASADPYEITYTNCRMYQDSIGSIWGQTIVEITNTGDHPLYLGSASYDLEDASGSLVAAQSYVSVFPDVLNPGEKGYLYEETILDQADLDAEYTVIPHLTIEPAKIDCIRYDVSELSLVEEEYLGPKVMGRVENSTEEDGTMVYVTAILYNAENTPSGIIFTILDSIPAGEKIGFEATAYSLPDDVTADQVASYTVYAYPTQFQF